MQRRVLGERASVPELDAWLARSGDWRSPNWSRALAPGLNRPWSRSRSTSGPGDRLDREGLDDEAAAALMTRAIGG